MCSFFLMQSYWQELLLTPQLNPQIISLKKYPIYGYPMWVQGTEKGERWNISNSRPLGQTGKGKIWWGGTSAWRQMHCLPQHQNLAHPPLLGMGVIEDAIRLKPAAWSLLPEACTPQTKPAGLPAPSGRENRWILLQRRYIWAAYINESSLFIIIYIK